MFKKSGILGKIWEFWEFNYLKHYLEGQAARVIDGLQMTEENYDAAKEMIRKRFGRKQFIITARIEELLKLKPCSGDKLNLLKGLYDKISIHLRGLQSLGVSSDSHGATLIPIVMGKLPLDIRV